MLVGSSDSSRKPLGDPAKQRLPPTTHWLVRWIFRAPWWLILMGLAWIAVIIAIRSSQDYLNIYSQLQEGVGLTLYLALTSYVLSLIIGLLVGLIRSYPPQPPEPNASPGKVLEHTIQGVVYNLATMYVEFMRGIPPLVFLLIAGFVIVPAVRDWINVNIMVPMGRELVWRGRDAGTAIAGLSLVYGAFLSEVFRSGIQSIAKGQMEAAKSLGMSWSQSMRYIIVPQAVRRILPELGNNFISMIKDTSLVTILGTDEITQIARKVSGSNFLYRETYAVLSLIYLTITISGSLLVQWVERTLKTEAAVTNNPDLMRRAPRLLAATIVLIILLIFALFRWIISPAGVPVP
jgi:polar amino acid transport system permease protein